MAHNIFITYNDPSELKSKQNRRAVSSFASKSYRPTSKQIVLDRSHYRIGFSRRPNSETPPPQADELKPKKKSAASGKRLNLSEKPGERVEATRVAEPRDDCPLGNPTADPFTTYPIQFRNYVPFLADYCKSTCRFLVSPMVPCMVKCIARPIRPTFHFPVQG